MKRIPKQISGLYYLYCGEEIVYIGKSINVFYRVGQHGQKSLDFDSWCYEEIALGELTRREREAILKHKPKYNRLTRYNRITGRTSTLFLSVTSKIECDEKSIVRSDNSSCA